MICINGQPKTGILLCTFTNKAYFYITRNAGRLLMDKKTRFKAGNRDI